MKPTTFAVLWLAIASTVHAQVHPLSQLIEAARAGPSSPGLEDLITKILTAKGGTAVWGQDYLFVTPSSSPATISIDSQPPLPMVQVGGAEPLGWGGGEEKGGAAAHPLF